MDKTYDIYKAELKSQQKPNKTELGRFQEISKNDDPQKAYSSVSEMQGMADAIFYGLHSWLDWLEDNGHKFDTTAYPEISEESCKKAIQTAGQLERFLDRMALRHPVDWENKR